MRVHIGVVLLACLLNLPGCAPVIVGAGVLAGGAVADERGMGGTISDAEIRTRINFLWYKQDIAMHNMLNLSVREGRALITGTVDTDQRHLDAVRLAWQAKGVKEVIDEVKVSRNTGGVGDYARDAWITTKLKSKILFDRDIASRNFNIMTVGAVVYIMGIAQTRIELEKVTEYARNINGVRRVVSHARIKTEMPAA